MFEPQGPLPPAVYWRRRWIAIAVLILVFALVVWIISSAVGSAQLPSGTVPTVHVAAAADPAPLSSPGPTASAIQATGVTTGVTTLAPAPEDERARPQSSTALAGPVPTSPGPASAATAVPGATPPVASAAPPPSAGSAAGPAPPAAAEAVCPDQVIGVTAQVGAPQYKLGERPAFRLVIVNNGTVPCRRDLDAALQELGLFTGDGGKKLWSSNDCFPGSTNDVRTLRPGEPVIFGLTWSGKTSAPGCRGARTQVGPGEYRLLSRLGGIISPPTQFRIVPA